MELKGRKRIYTDYAKVTDENVLNILRDSMPVHEINREEMIYLLNFEKGIQPLQREKVIRPEIDIQNIANMASQITEFKLGYVWGYPVAIVQKSNSIPDEKSEDADNKAISYLNEYYYAEEYESKDQEMARYVEICGIGYQMVDIKRNMSDGDSPFDLTTISPLYAFIVYSSDVRHEPMLGVTYSVNKNGQIRHFTCISKDKVYQITSMYKLMKDGSRAKDKKTGEDLPPEYSIDDGDSGIQSNPFNRIYIGECNRSFDRTGCFERLIDELNALNILESDLSNDVSQNTQSIWWGNDIEFEVDEAGNAITPSSGQWITTKTNQNSGKQPNIKPLTLVYDYSGVINNIKTKHDAILERAFVPKQSDPGGGSTGSAMSLSSGWSAAEAVASKESLVLKKFFQWRNRVAILACQKSAQIDDPKIISTLKELSPNDVDIRFTRQKTFDMATKVNSLATMINCMVDPKSAMTTIDLFPNLAETIEDSIDNMKKYQDNLLKNNEKEEKEEDEKSASMQALLNGNVEPIDTVDSGKTMQDMSDQAENSPIGKMQ